MRNTASLSCIRMDWALCAMKNPRRNGCAPPRSRATPWPQHGLGFMYMDGDCLRRDGNESAAWFEKAAAQGLVGSQTTLAMIYEQGDIVDQDLEKAKKWYQLAGFDEK